MNGSLLLDAFAHHVWATLRLIEACEPLTADQLETTVPGTYGSIIATLRHTIAADVSYISVFGPPPVGEVDEETADLPTMRAAMEAMGTAWRALLATDLDPDRMVVRHRDDGTDSGAPLSIRLAQVIHHGTDHRSQICTALTTLGIEPPEIDVWQFAEQGGRLEVTPSTS